MQAARAILASLLLALAACAGLVSTEPTARAQGEALEQRPAEVCEPSPLEAAELEALAFSSPERCDALVRSGRLLPRAPGTVRFGSWNVRFFPDGGPSGPSKPTDVAWLACAIAFMQVDVLAVQEFLAPVGDSAARVGEKHRELVARLDALTGGRWAIVLDECEKNRPDRQHVGFVVNRARVELSRVRHVSKMNPDGGCRNLRPGLAADVRAPGGLDLHVVSFHAKAYADAKSRGRREHVYASMREIVEEIRRGSRETDLLVLGDFNTVGCEACPVPETPEDEARALAGAAEAAGLVHVATNRPCSHFWDRQGRFGRLDHVLADASMRELRGSVRVSGFCAATACAHHGGAAHAALSDHCPLLVDLVDEDRDP